MVKPRFISRIRRLWLGRRYRRNGGFTLTELLVAMLIGTIITGALLSLVIDLTETNQKDVARSETQRDAQSAMNYIVEDVREAIFVYDGDCLQGSGTTASMGTFCPGIINHIPTTMSGTSGGASYKPVLAFWRADDLPSQLAAECRTRANSNTLTAFNTYLTRVPCVAGRSYTLVVYAVATDLDPNDQWRGRARLVRYQLPQFTSATDAANPTPTTGWVDPLANDGTFQSWPYQKPAGATTYTNQQAARPGNSPSVLIDFMDDTNPSSLPINSRPACTAPSRLTPNNPSVQSFYACVRGNTLNAQSDVTLASELNVNQEVLLVLTANPAGRAGIPLNSPNNSDRLSPLQARVLTRGVVQKTPQ